MTLGTGSRSRGFTLIEIVLVLALIALGSGLIIANFIAFTDRGDSEFLVDVLHRAIREARFVAAADRTTTALFYNAENGSLILEPDGTIFSLGEGFQKNAREGVRFFMMPSSEGLSLPRGGISPIETERVFFSPDRSGTPFFVELNEGRGSPLKITYDPFSGAVLSEK